MAESASVCRGKQCDAPVRFVPTLAGSTLVVNAEPSRKGTVWIHEVTGALRGQVLTKDAARGHHAAGIDLYLDHHATCGNADDFRPKRGRRTSRG